MFYYLVKINGNKVDQCYVGFSTFLRSNSIKPTITFCNTTLVNKACMVSFLKKDWKIKISFILL